MPSGVLLGSSPWYQTFHSSKEMYTSCVLFRRAFVASMAAATSLMNPSMSTPEARKLAMSACAVLFEERLVVGVAGDEVHVLVGLLKMGLLPFAECGHAVGGGAADHQFHIRVDLAHAGGHGRGERP